MARDLIPPPSPAGRPQTPDGRPNLIELPPEPPRSGAQPAQEQPKSGPSRFRNRFGFLLGGLGGVVLAAAVVTGIVVYDQSNDPAAEAGLAANWSKWHPGDTSVAGGAAEIADHVAAEYRHADGKQLVKVTGGPLGIGIALRPSSGTISSFSGNGVLYQLDGLGPSGSIKGGKPSPERLQLVRREALELALYTFRYLPDADMVVTFLPPPPPDAGTAEASAVSGLLSGTPDPKKMTAIFYRPGDLKQQLQIPLGSTVKTPAPTPEQMGGAEGKLVDQLTNSNLFHWSLTRTQDANLQLVLDRST